MFKRLGGLGFIRSSCCVRFGSSPSTAAVAAAAVRLAASLML